MPSHYSASQVSTFQDCHRKWAYRYIDEIEAPPNKYAQLGSMVHVWLEKYLKTGELPKGPETALQLDDGKIYTYDDLLKIMLPGLQYLPKPGTCEVEGYFTMQIKYGSMVGYIDAEYIDKMPIVIDHKTTSNLRWALTVPKLRENIQAVIYAKYIMQKYGVDEVQLQWVYYQTSTPKGKSVSTKLRLTDIEGPWQTILDTIAEMEQIHNSGSKAAEVEYNAGSCNKYGGCPHRALCNLTPQDIMKGHRQMATLKEQMKMRHQELAAKKAPPPPPEPAPEPAKGAEQAVNPPEGKTALERLKAQRAAQKAEQAQFEAPKATPPTVKKAPKAAKPVKPTKPVKADEVRAKLNTVAQPQGYILYVDCCPLAGDPVNFSKIADKVVEDLKTEHGVHYMQIEGLYGGNVSVFVEALKQHLDDTPPAQDIVMRLTSPEARNGFDVLASRAKMVVQGW